jgi:hypothetical protein
MEAHHMLVILAIAFAFASAVAALIIMRTQTSSAHDRLARFKSIIDFTATGSRHHRPAVLQQRVHAVPTEQQEPGRKLVQVLAARADWQSSCPAQDISDLQFQRRWIRLHVRFPKRHDPQAACQS